MLKPMAKLWFKKGKVSIIGEGRSQLLRAVEEHGSIAKAASAMGMSYRHAWGIIRHIREVLGDEIVKTTRGGTHGGGAFLTARGKEILDQYEQTEREIRQILKYGPKPALAVDGIIFDKDNNLVLIRRKNPPFKGQLAIPGGFVEYNETTEEAVKREIREELGIPTQIIGLVGVYSEPSRDPRQHIVSVVYLLEPLSNKFKAGDDALAYEIIHHKSIKKLRDLAFDHDRIISDAIILRNKKKDQ
jgi:8-oxo-dGTP diphosphatase